MECGCKVSSDLYKRTVQLSGSLQKGNKNCDDYGREAQNLLVTLFGIWWVFFCNTDDPNALGLSFLVPLMPSFPFISLGTDVVVRNAQASSNSAISATSNEVRRRMK